MIVLTGQDDYEVDVQASELGVTDYLVKGTDRRAEPGAHDPLRGPPPPSAGRAAPQRGALRGRRPGHQRRDLGLGPRRREHALLRALEGAARLRRRVCLRPADAWFDLVHPDDVERLRREIDLHLPGTSPHFENEHRIRHATASWRWVLTRGLTTRDADGRPRRITGSLTDITDRQGGPGAADPRRAARQPDRAAQPRALPRPPEHWPARTSSATRLRLRGALRRHRPLQARQRQPQPRGRRPAADRDRPPRRRASCARATRGAPGRRRVRDPARRRGSRRACARGRRAGGEARSPSRALRPARAVGLGQHRHRPQPRRPASARRS